MTKTALVFAGQGAQAIGMGKELAENFPLAKELFGRANEILGYDLSKICFEGPESELIKTEHAQPGIYLVGWVAFQVLRQEAPNLHFNATAGLSLGEFTALAAAGSLSFEDGLKLVRQRGLFMQQACEETRGSMAAIIGLDEETTGAVCAEAGVDLANLNCPGQIVISGETDKVSAACDLAKTKGAKKALPLNVAGAYHSTLMAKAQEKLQVSLAEVFLSSPQIPVISNVTAEPHGNPDAIRATLTAQVTSSVKWEASMRYLLAQGFTRFIELGPGTALTGFMKRIEKSATYLNVADTASLQTTLKVLAAVN